MKNNSSRELLLSIVLVAASLVTTASYAGSADTNKVNKNPVNVTIQKTTKAVSDAAITATIKAKYANSDLLSASDIQSKTMYGNVWLSGTLNTDLQYEKAIILADSVSGVKNVNAKNLYVTDSQRPLKDIYITAKVKGQLLREKLLGKNFEVWPLQIETKNDVVYINGEVTSEALKNNILNSVKYIKGIKSIKANINVDHN